MLVYRINIFSPAKPNSDLQMSFSAVGLHGQLALSTLRHAK